MENTSYQMHNAPQTVFELIGIACVPATPEWVCERKEYCMAKYHDRNIFRLDYSDDCYLVYYVGEGDTHSHPFSPDLFPVTEEVPEGLVQQLRDKHKEMEELYGTK